MKLYCALILTATLTTGCASTQLNNNALDLASTVDSLVSRQILYNLSKFIDNPSAIPTQVNISSGSATTTNSVTASFADPVSKAVTLARTVAGAGVTNSTTTAKGAKTVTPAATDTWSQTWTLSTITDPDQMRRVRALYRFAIGASGDLNDPEFKRECKLKLPQKFITAEKHKFRRIEGIATKGELNPNYVANDIEPYCPNIQAEYPLVKKSITDQNKGTAFANDPAFLIQPGCIFCIPPGYSTPIGVSDRELVLNPRLTNNWLNWEPILGGAPRFAHGPHEVPLGDYGGYRLFAANQEAYSQFMLFILESTAQSTAIGGGGGNKSNNTNGPLIIVPGGG